MKKYLFRITPGSIGMMLLGVVINIAGRHLAASLSLPLWMDAGGTMFCAVTLGPIAGAVVGALSNIIFATGSIEALFYVPTNLSVGLIVGLMYPGDFREHFRIMMTALFSALVTVIISTPLNVRFYGGYTGNVWGDALYDMLGESGSNSAINSFLSECFVDFPDKIATLFCVVLAVMIFEKLRRSK